MKTELLSSIENLKMYVQISDITKEAEKSQEWNGADVIIAKVMQEETKKWLSEQSLVISYEKTEPRRRAIITEYAKELSWLFNKLKDLFSKEIDYISKYDFYGSLAQSAINYLETHKEHKCKELLYKVLLTAKGYAQDEISK